MTIYDKVKKKLEESEAARERKNKNRMVAQMYLSDNYVDLKYKMKGIEDAGSGERGKIAKAKLVDMFEEFTKFANSADRAWCKVTEENEDLQGTDYHKKTDLEVEKQRELGYNV